MSSEYNTEELTLQLGNMNMPTDVLIDLQEKYNKAVKLMKDDSKKDPENDPYRSKYAANTILMDIKSKLVKLIDDVNPGDNCYLTYKAMLGVVWLLLGTIHVETEELSAGEELLSNCVDSLSDESLHPACIITVVTALNQLGILWSQRDQPTRSQVHLERAEKLYKDYMKEVTAIPILNDDLFHTSNSECSDEDSQNSLEKLHTLTLFYLAQIYGTLNDHLKSAVYCHTTLKRQLESGDFDEIDWSLNSATLSQYFAERNDFTRSRHHLAAASYILERYQCSLDQIEELDDVFEAKKERFGHRGADVARCWAKYGLLLLGSSMERLMLLASDEGENAASDDFNPSLHNEVNHLCFHSLDLSDHEGRISDRPILTFEDARKVFLNSQEWLNRAKEFYRLDNHASDYIQIVQDQSQLYKHLIFFEDDEERQCRMNKRRIDLLEAAVKELNPQYYMAVCRQLWFELAETLADMLDVKVQRLREAGDRPSQHCVNKVNQLASQSVAHFTTFLDSLKDSSTNEMPTKLSDEMVQPVLMAYFHMGRLHNKMVASDKAVRLDNLERSLACYRMLVHYHTSHSHVDVPLVSELSGCREMVELLPLKIEKLRREM